MSEETPKNTDTENDSSEDDFADLANEKKTGILAEFADFLLESKKWWLIPIILALLLIGLLVILSGTAVAPFIYTLF